MKRILLSDLKNYKKINGSKIPIPIDNSNGIVDLIKQNVSNTDKIVYVASDINKPHYIVESYANILFNSLEMSGIKFKQNLILDGENKSYASDFISGADIVFLCGGSTYDQHQFFEEIKLKSILKDYNGLLIGQSAGALNMALNVFNSPEMKEESEPIFFEGLGLTDINIEPHFIYDSSKFDDKEEYEREAILNESYNRPIYGQCNGSYIYIDEKDNSIIYGETYLISNGKIECICKDGETFNISCPNFIKK